MKKIRNSETLYSLEINFQIKYSINKAFTIYLTLSM